MPFFYILVSIVIFNTINAYGAGMLVRVQQMKSHHKQEPQMTQEQYEQYQEYLKDHQNEAKPDASTAPPRSYQEIIDARNKAISDAIAHAHHGDRLDTGQSQKTAKTNITHTDDAQEIDLGLVWKKLDTQSRPWTLFEDQQAKVLTVAEYINRFHQQGAMIKQPPLHYVEMIDQIVGQNPDMLDRPFGDLIQLVAIVDYDFDNGTDKDELAKKFLGEAGYEANKKRFTQNRAQAN